MSEEHLKRIYTNAVFAFYSNIDKSINRIALNNKTYEMAVDIHMRLGKMDIEVLQH